MSQSRLGATFAIVLGHLALSSCGSEENDESSTMEAPKEKAPAEGKPKGSDNPDEPEPSETPAEPSEAGNGSIVLAQADYLPPVGTTMEISKSFVVTDSVVELESKEKRVHGSASASNVQKFAAKVDSDSEVTVEVVEDYKTNKLILNEQLVKEPEPQHSAVHGTVVRYKRSEDTWTPSFSKDGAPLEPNEAQQAKAKRIARNLLSHQSALEMYGTEPRKVGDQWKVDAANLSIFSDEESETSGEVSLTYLREESIEGIRCAVIAGEFIVNKKAGNMMTKMNGKLEAFRSPELMADVSLTLSGILTSNGSPQPGLKTTSTGPFKTTFTTKVNQP